MELNNPAKAGYRPFNVCNLRRLLVSNLSFSLTLLLYLYEPSHLPTALWKPQACHLRLRGPRPNDLRSTHHQRALPQRGLRTKTRRRLTHRHHQPPSNISLQHPFPDQLAVLKHHPKVRHNRAPTAAVAAAPRHHPPLQSSLGALPRVPASHNPDPAICQRLLLRVAIIRIRSLPPSTTRSERCPRPLEASTATHRPELLRDAANLGQPCARS